MHKVELTKEGGDDESQKGTHAVYVDDKFVADMPALNITEEETQALTGMFEKLITKGRALHASDIRDLNDEGAL